MSPIASGDRGGAQQDKEPSQKQASPAEVPEQALQSGVKRCSHEVAQRSPTLPEDNSGGRSVQVRVPWTQAWLCTKDSLGKCTGAGVASKHAVPSNAVWRGEGDDSVDPREISSELLVQRGGRLPPQHAPPGKQSRRRQDQRYRVAVVVFATLLQFCRLPARSAVDSSAEGEERDAEELG
ncbi:hypothetical protein NDU88_001679 [Pleurodeles waltl]|uniref:Uncharacterized protein n=1 Tax=Pleurodeles waltl TaxID=8319 RepID=A0AAV7TIX7_PLEWA|nr:hypothetical protein NDU88_001679 [Pleurodeles waltl]